MTHSIFFRLLKTPIDVKRDVLRELVQNVMRKDVMRKEHGEAFALDPADFALIPGSPFAYWVSDSIRQLFTKLSKVESEGRAVRVGDHPGDQDRYMRLFWEVSSQERGQTRQWLPYQKGGTYSLYYADIHLVVDWDLKRETYNDFHGRPGRSSEHPSNYQFFFRPGLTWPRRTQKGLNLRAMPAGCIFADKGPVAFVPNDDPDDLLALLAVMNSLPFQMLVELQMAFGSYEVGVIQRTPVPVALHASRSTLAALARQAYDLQRERDLTDETTHAFGLPGLVRHREAHTLLEASQALQAEAQAAGARLAALQAHVDDLVFDLYGLDAADRALVRAEMGQTEAIGDQPPAVGGQPDDTQHASRFTFDALRPEDDSADEEPALPEDLPRRVQDLLMWCIGVAFGRWDVRLALDPALLPSLPGPFDPLPRCAPGALVGADGLPAQDASRIAFHAPRTTHHAPPSTPYPLPIAWDGILVDDPTHPSDIVTRVRGVLALLWGERADAIEREAYEVLGFKSLRDYFRDPRRGFFDFHVKRYSKSRRKAPIYWPLQSEKRGYTLWLYYPRLNPSTLFAAGRDYADAKVALEAARLEELRAGLEALSGSAPSASSGQARRQREREVERQQSLVAEVTAFRNRLDAVALLTLQPDLNDGVLLNIAPLWELVPWKEAARMWEELAAGKYAWSSIARQMREKGLVKHKT